LRLRLLAKWGLKRISRSSLWDADHIVPVVEGGGECDLENLRTLCLICHRQQTLALRRRLGAAQRSIGGRSNLNTQDPAPNERPFETNAGLTPRNAGRTLKSQPPSKPMTLCTQAASQLLRHLST